MVGNATENLEPAFALIGPNAVPISVGDSNNAKTGTQRFHLEGGLLRTRLVIVCGRVRLEPSKRTGAGITKGSSHPAGAEFDAAEDSRNHEQPFEIAGAKHFEEFHTGPADLAVIPCLLHDPPVIVPHPARPTVVTRLVVFLFSFC